MFKKRYDIVAKLGRKIIDRVETDDYQLALAELENFEEKYGMKYDVEFLDRKGGFDNGIRI